MHRFCLIRKSGSQVGFGFLSGAGSISDFWLQMHPGHEASTWLAARFLSLAWHAANEAQFERQIEIDCDI